MNVCELNWGTLRMVVVRSPIGYLTYTGTTSEYPDASNPCLRIREMQRYDKMERVTLPPRSFRVPFEVYTMLRY